MTLSTHVTRRRLWLAPEVVQSSAMDCGPAALKCLLGGFGIQVSYGRLREACQTDVDGTSIDTLEVVANELGVQAEQVMIPADHVFLDSASALPALVVVRHSSGASHFVVVWRRFGAWLQVMDPSVGRRWVHQHQFDSEIFRHELSVAAADWRAWAATDEFLSPLRERVTHLGAGEPTAAELIVAVLADEGWFSIGALDAAVRLVTALIQAGGVKAGAEAIRLVGALFRQTRDSERDIFRFIPQAYWSVSPDAKSSEGELHLLLRGAVLLRVIGPCAQPGDARPEDSRPLSPELVAALNQEAPSPLRAIFGLLKTDGLLAPLALMGAIGIAAAATVVEALLMRGIFDIGGLLHLGSQRLIAVLALLSFIGMELALNIPIITEALRFGRRLDIRLRAALLRKLPRLTDRYFQSRPVSDMADRSHSIHLTRVLPGMGIHFLQALCVLALTLAGIAWIDPISGAFALVIAAVAILVPAVFQPIVNERDLRVRNHSGALNSFYLDALLGLVPIRTHRAELAVRHQYEGLLVEWVRSTRRFIRTTVLTDALQSVLCIGLAGALLIEHFLRAEGVTGMDLLLVYWTLKLPSTGSTITALAHQYPMQRNVLLRLLEPLSAPEHVSPETSARTTTRPVIQSAHAGAALRIEGGTVVAAGHTILQNIDVSLSAGEHVAVIGRSGAGKSSLIGVLLGWHRLASGRLLIDGVEIGEAELSGFRRRIAWVDPAVQIWNTSFLENLNYSADDLGFLRSASAIDAANLRGVLQKLPKGLQTPLGEGGGLLSGGEGQRMRLARAFAQSNVRLALLDEPFRGLDREQRSALLASTRRHWDGATLICATHDVSETLSFARVLVVESGRIVEDGDPNQLARQPSRFRDLLEAERMVRDGMWAGRQWRRIHVQDGLVDSASMLSPRRLQSGS